MAGARQRKERTLKKYDLINSLENVTVEKLTQRLRADLNKFTVPRCKKNLFLANS